MTDNPTFFDERLSDGEIDQATVNSLMKWFKLRIVCDDFNFDTFFDRQLDLVLPRYNKLIRLENTEFDAMVNTYRERQSVYAGSETGTVERTNDLADTTTVVQQHASLRTPDITVANEGETSSTSEADTSTTNNSETTGDNSGKSVSVSKQNPQTISYAGAAAGSIPSLDWTYPSTQQQSENETDSHTVSESSGTSSSDTSTNGTSQSTQTTTGTEQTTGSDRSDQTRTSTGTVTDDSSRSRDDLTREQWTGRDGLTPQEALRTAMAYVKTSSAFSWLKEQLEVCFLSVYDI